MRAREMMAKLDRLPTPKGEAKTWDVSLLSPEKQDRYSKLSELIFQSKDINSRSLDGVFLELIDLVDDLPLLGPHDPQQGPLIEVPGTLARYWQLPPGASKWRSYDFYRLSKIQTLRLVELCEQYGYVAGLSLIEIKEQMTPLHQWRTDDRAKMKKLLDIGTTRTGGTEMCKEQTHRSARSSTLLGAVIFRA
jgi:hypothetical protein